MKNTPSKPDITDHSTRIPRSGSGVIVVSQVVGKRNLHKRNLSIKIGTWNIRTLLNPRELEKIKMIMKRNDVNTLGLCRTIQHDKAGSIRVIYRGEVNNGKNGMTIILRRKWAKNVLNTYHVDDRLLISIDTQPTSIVLIQFYFSTMRHDEEKMEEKVKDLLKLTNKKDKLFIMKDFNAAVSNTLSTVLRENLACGR